jgi:hypothetical protein
MTPAESRLKPGFRWYHKAAAVLLATFCLELGLFLMIFPWIEPWSDFAAFLGAWRHYFDNLYIRGAISGVGIVNLCISLSEVMRLRRFSRR